jgi:hypothetical protein
MRREQCAGALAALALVVWLAGCGRAAGGATPSAAATYANTSPPTQAGGAVRLTTDHTSYRPNEPIHVTVTNTLDQSIYALDTRASCSILGLEWQVGGAWQPAESARCPLGRMALVVEIAPGATYQTTISAGYPGLRAANFPAGTYRLVLNYSSAKLGLGETGAGTILYSASFTIAGKPLPPIPAEPTVPIAVTVTLLP